MPYAHKLDAYLTIWTPGSEEVDLNSIATMSEKNPSTSFPVDDRFLPKVDPLAGYSRSSQSAAKKPGQVGPTSSRQELIAVYQTEVAANISEGQVCSNIMVGVLGFVAACFAILIDRTPDVVVFLAMPTCVALACAFLLMKTAVIVSRAASAREMEKVLGESSPLDEEFSAGLVGASRYGAIDDVNSILAETSRWRFLRAALAASAYMGVYLVSIAFTSYIAWRLYRSHQLSTEWFTVAACYLVVLWAGVSIGGLLHMARATRVAEADAMPCTEAELKSSVGNS